MARPHDLSTVQTLADLEDLFESLSDQDRHAVEADLARDIERQHAGVPPRQQAGAAPNAKQLVVSTAPVTSFANGDTAICFKMKHRSDVRYIACGAREGCTLDDLADLARATLDIHRKDLRLICKGRLIRFSGMNAELVGKTLLAELHGQTVILLGSSFKLSDSFAQSIASRGVLSASPLQSDASLPADSFDEAVRRLKADMDAKRARAGSVTQDDLLYYQDTDVLYQEDNKFSGIGVPFGTAILFPYKTPRHLAYSLFGIGAFPIFSCRCRITFDDVRSIGCNVCTLAWLKKVETFVGAALEAECQSLRFRLERRSEPRPNVTVPLDDALGRRRDLKERHASDTLALDVVRNELLRLRKNLDYLDKVMNDERYILGANVGVVQQELYMLTLAIKCLQTIQEIEMFGCKFRYESAVAWRELAHRLMSKL